MNVSAIEEYQEVRERYDALSAQVADVEGSRNELTRMIASLSGQMKEIFTDSFRAINENFGRIFAELFGGGEASLVLEDEAMCFPAALAFQVAPPGKVIKNLEALSGGEQALVAISIYLRSWPSTRHRSASWTRSKPLWMMPMSAALRSICAG